MPHPGTRRRRILVRVLKLLLIGAACAYLSAWGAATKELVQDLLRGYTTYDYRLVEVPGTAGDQRLVVAWYARHVGYEYWYIPAEIAQEVTLVTLAPRAELPAWVPRPEDDPQAGSGASAYGWPFLCAHLKASWRSTSSLGPDVRTPRGMWRVPLLGGSLLLPLLPIGRGLIANTLVYAAAIALLTTGPRALRAHRRRRRGRCPRCGYDLAGLSVGAPCPECGNAPRSDAVPARAGGNAPAP